MKTSINMKKTKNLLSLLLVICFSSWGFSAVNPKTGPHLADSISGIRAYKAILHYKGEPVCVANATSSLTPSFLSAGSGSIETTEELDGPQCDTEDMNRIYTIAQNSILVDDPEKGVEVAAVFIPYVALCVGSAVAGGALYYLFHTTQLPNPQRNDELLSIGMGGIAGSAISLYSTTAEANGPSILKKFWKDLKPAGKIVPVAVTCGMAGGFSVQYLLSDEQ